MYISNGVCADLPPFSDGGVAFTNRDSSGQADVSNEGGPSADWGDAQATPAPGPSDPLAPCAVASDIFFIRGMNQMDPGMSVTYTNLDATFQASVSPALIVTVSRGSPGGALAYLRVTGAGAVAIRALGTPGTYETGSQGLNLELLAGGAGVHDRLT